MNLYGFLGNDGVRRVDIWGLKCTLSFESSEKNKESENTPFNRSPYNGNFTFTVSSSGMQTDADGPVPIDYLRVNLKVEVGLEKPQVETVSLNHALEYTPACIEPKPGKKTCVVECGDKKEGEHYGGLRDNFDKNHFFGRIGASTKIVSQKGCGTKAVNVKVRGVAFLSTNNTGIIVINGGVPKIASSPDDPDTKYGGAPHEFTSGPKLFKVLASGTPDPE